MVVGLRLGHGHSNREGQNGVTREIALGAPAKANVLALGLGLIIKPQQLPCWHAEPLLYLEVQACGSLLFHNSAGEHGRFVVMAACTKHMKIVVSNARRKRFPAQREANA